jgi:hypothetical protein
MLDAKNLFYTLLLLFPKKGVQQTEHVELSTLLPLETKKEEVVGKLIKVKITTYHTPKVHARYEPVGKFIHRINVYKKGKTFPIYVISSKGLYVEGFLKVILPDKSFYIDHNWNWSEFVKDSKGKKLKIGDSASRYFGQGTEFIYKGKKSKIVDTGSGLSKKVPHIDLYTGEGDDTKRTEYAEILLLDNN